MEIAIDIRETVGLKTGKGWYTFAMVKNILRLDHGNEYVLYTHEHNSDFDEYPNATQRVIKKVGFRWHLAVIFDLRRTKPDIFWAPTSYIIPALAPRSVKIVVTVHDIVAFLFPEGHNKKAVWLERLTLHRAVKKSHQILTVSRNTKHDLIKVFNVSGDKIPIASCASSDKFKPIEDPVRIEAVRKKYDLPDKFILAVGTLSPRKNFDRMILAYAQVLQKHDDTDLVIVGTKGWNFEKIVQFDRSDRVNMIGYVDGDDLPVLYSLAELFVFPSLYEGFGIPPLEAMACGCPVVTSNVSSLPEVVGNAAMLVDPYSVDEIAHAMDVILSNKYVALELREKGLERAKRFSWEESARKIVETFQSQ
ncbi:MAG: glycosyltransferase family 1 protein [Candidatus Peregrinibacteria bacterium]|nr:glycosyltransferase family 1 protein [Candidatus Peregrinibacteria bacterium]